MASPSFKRSLTALLFLLFALPGLALLPAPAAADYYDFTAYIDSQSYLIIQGDTVQWHNANGWPPGQFPQFPASDPTTYITTSSSPGVPINWIPDWPGWLGGPGEAWSSVYTGLTPALPQTPLSIILTQEQGRGTISIFQFPAAANDYTLIVEFNDGPFDAAYWYEGRLDFAPVPVPGTILLLGSGLLGLGLPGLRRRIERR